MTGPLAVTSSAGSDVSDPDQMLRIGHFGRASVTERTLTVSLDGDGRAGIFRDAFDLRDGSKVYVWRDDKDVMRLAYVNGLHRSFVDQSRDGSIVDRSSLAATRIVSSSGS